MNGINNPCPPCYRLPTSAEWEAELDTFQNYAAIGAFNSPLKLTLAGNRSNVNGFFEAEDDLGEYWSSTLKDELATYMFFDENGSRMRSIIKWYDIIGSHCATMSFF